MRFFAHRSCGGDARLADDTEVRSPLARHAWGVIFDRLREYTTAKPSCVRSHAILPTRAPSPQLPSPKPGHAPTCFFPRGVPLPERSGPRGLAGRVVLPSARPAALMGFNP